MPESSTTASIAQSIVTYDSGVDPPSEHISRRDPEMLALPPSIAKEPLQLCDDDGRPFSMISIDATESVLTTRALALEPETVHVESTISQEEPRMSASPPMANVLAAAKLVSRGQDT